MKKANRDGIRYKQITIKVLTITDQGNITGVKYGPVEIPVTIKVPAFPFDKRTTPINTKKQSTLKQTHPKQKVFEQGTNAAQKAGKTKANKRITIECPYHFFTMPYFMETPKSLVRTNNKHLQKLKTQKRKRQRQTKYNLQKNNAFCWPEYQEPITQEDYREESLINRLTDDKIIVFYATHLEKSPSQLFAALANRILQETR